jgi:glycosyltransferase involved in cell wall biosynthesis
MKLTILMPCLDEAETIEACVKAAKAWIDRSGISAEVLVADNGSTDGSQALARAAGARVVEVPDKGYGSALFAGTLAAQGGYLVMGDADGSYDFGHLEPFIQKLDEGCDLVMGNRFQGGIDPGAMPLKSRYFGNPFLSLVARLLFKTPVGDIQCGLRAYTKAAFFRMDLRSMGMEYASEMVIKAATKGLRIGETPTTLVKDGRSRPPHLRPFRDGWRNLRFMLLFSPRWLFTVPSALVALGSLAAYLRLLAGPLTVGAVTFDYHTMLFAQAGILLGFLGLVFGVLLRLIGIREGLLGANPALERLNRSYMLEAGALLGGLAILGGALSGLALLGRWGQRGFGPLGPEEMLRQVSFASLLVVGGGVVLCASLLIGFIGIPTREARLRQGAELSQPAERELAGA